MTNLPQTPLIKYSSSSDVLFKTRQDIACVYSSVFARDAISPPPNTCFKQWFDFFAKLEPAIATKELGRFSSSAARRIAFVVSLGVRLFGRGEQFVKLLSRLLPRAFTQRGILSFLIASKDASSH